MRPELRSGFRVAERSASPKPAVLVRAAGTSFRVPFRGTFGFAEAARPRLVTGAPPPSPRRRSRGGSTTAGLTRLAYGTNFRPAVLVSSVVASLASFHPSVGPWFRSALGEPTRAQLLGWPPVARGESTLLLAPTGSGKTLAAFLVAID